jgi:hypothetical protein
MAEGYGAVDYLDRLATLGKTWGLPFSIQITLPALSKSLMLGVPSFSNPNTPDGTP